MACLTYIDNHGHPQSADIVTKVTIGRADSNDIVLEDSLVSRRHCAVELRDDRVVVSDLGSTYGTFVNNQRVEIEKTLSPGDMLRVGTRGLTFLSDIGVLAAEYPLGEDTKPLARAMLAEVTALCADLEAHLRESPDDIQRTTGIARSIGERLVSAEEALEDLELSQRLHRTLSEVGKLIGAVTDLATVIRLTMDMAISVLGADRGFILLRDEGGTLTPRATRHMEREVRALIRRGISQSIAHDVSESGRPMLTTDAQLDPRFKETESVMVHDIRAVMCVPLKNKEMEVIGTIYVDGPPGSPVFSERGLKFLTSFAAQATVAIENAQLVAQVALEEKLRERLSRYFSPGVVEDILSGEEELTTRGTSRVVTVLFMDIRGFTRILERLEPQEAVEMLNDFFEEIVEEVRFEEGTLDKFTGDGFMAFWGAPRDQQDHAQRAVRAALKMQEKLPAIRNRWRVENRSFARETGALTMGIGIHSGAVIVGDVGSSKRIEYTAIGDAVNVAARVQGLAKGGDVLVTRATLDILGANAEYEVLEPAKVKGKSEPIELFRMTELNAGDST